MSAARRPCAAAAVPAAGGTPHSRARALLRTGPTRTYILYYVFMYMNRIVHERGK